MKSLNLVLLAVLFCVVAFSENTYASCSVYATKNNLFDCGTNNKNAKAVETNEKSFWTETAETVGGWFSSDPKDAATR